MRRLRRWVRWDALKRPLSAWGGVASVSDPSSWCSYGEARESQVGVGLGFVLAGDGLGCFDLDHVLHDGVLVPAAARFLGRHRGFLTEVSPSGDGLHVWVMASPQRGWRRRVDGISVEFYTRGRYMTVTGVRYGVRLRGGSAASA